MEPQQRPQDGRQRNAGPGPGSPGGGSTLPDLTQQASALAAASQDIINAALSGDSQAFLRATRQAGGQ